MANESGSQRPRSVRRWLEPSLLNGASAERRGLDRFDIGQAEFIDPLFLIKKTLIAYFSFKGVSFYKK